MDNLEQIVVTLQNKLHAPNPDYQTVVKEADALRHEDLRLLLIWIKASSHGKKADFINTCIENFSKVKDRKSLDHFDTGLAQIVSKLSLLDEDYFSYNDYLLAQHVLAKSKQVSDPQKFIQGELPANKQLSFFSQRLNDAKSFPIPEELFKTAKIIKHINQITSKAPVAAATSTSKQAKQSTASQAIPSRKHAYDMIREIARYLIENEPHAFTGYILERLASLEYTPLVDAIKEFPQLHTLINTPAQNKKIDI